MERWKPGERLIHEKESLGFYITGHPLDHFQRELKRSATTDTLEIQKVTEKREEKVGGVVAVLREITTKKGERMAFVTLEDLKGTLEVVVFSDLYRRRLALLKGNDPILIQGTTDVGEESVKLIARDVAPLKASSASVYHEVHFHLASRVVTRDQLERLKNLLANHRGALPAFIHLKGEGKGETILSLPKDLMVNPSDEMMMEVDSLFGTPVTFLQ